MGWDAHVPRDHGATRCQFSPMKRHELINRERYKLVRIIGRFTNTTLLFVPMTEVKDLSLSKSENRVHKDRPGIAEQNGKR